MKVYLVIRSIAIFTKGYLYGSKVELRKLRGLKNQKTNDKYFALKINNIDFN
jgi:hypothetical protein